MEILNNLVVSFNDFLWGYILIILLIGAGLLFSFKTKFVQCGSLYSYCYYSFNFKYY